LTFAALIRPVPANAWHRHISLHLALTSLSSPMQSITRPQLLAFALGAALLLAGAKLHAQSARRQSADRATSAANANRGAQERTANRPIRDPNLIFAGGVPKTVDDLRAMQEIQQRLITEVSPSVVGVRVGPSQGTGVIVNEQGYVMTAAHVIGEPGRDATFILHDGRTVKGKTLGADYDNDAGLAQITDRGDWHAAAVGASDKVKVGQWVLALGHPGGYQRGRNPVVRLGRVLRLTDDGITTDCTLVGGDSGGPLFDMQGRVIAVHSRIGNSLTTNVHVPVGYFRTGWDRLARGEAWGIQPGIGPFIGVTGSPQPDDPRIAHVHPASPAERAGIKPGDIVTRFDGRALDGFDELIRAIREKKPGDKVKIEVRRASRTLTLELVIGSRGENDEDEE
jgi:serine protease Do